MAGHTFLFSLVICVLIHSSLSWSGIDFCQGENCSGTCYHWSINECLYVPGVVSLAPANTTFIFSSEYFLTFSVFQMESGGLGFNSFWTDNCKPLSGESFGNIITLPVEPGYTGCVNLYTLPPNININELNILMSLTILGATNYYYSIGVSWSR